MYTPGLLDIIKLSFKSNKKYDQILLLLASGVLGFPKTEVRSPAREIFWEIVLGLCWSTREAAERKSVMTGGLTLLGCFYKLETRGACVKRLSFLKGGLGNFLFQGQLISNCVAWYLCSPEVVVGGGVDGTCSSLPQPQKGYIAVKPWSSAHVG